VPGRVTPGISHAHACAGIAAGGLRCAARRIRPVRGLSLRSNKDRSERQCAMCVRNGNWGSIVRPARHAACTSYARPCRRGMKTDGVCVSGSLTMRPAEERLAILSQQNVHSASRRLLPKVCSLGLIWRARMPLIQKLLDLPHRMSAVVYLVPVPSSSNTGKVKAETRAPFAGS